MLRNFKIHVSINFKITYISSSKVKNEKEQKKFNDKQKNANHTTLTITFKNHRVYVNVMLLKLSEPH